MEQSLEDTLAALSYPKGFPGYKTKLRDNESKCDENSTEYTTDNTDENTDLGITTTENKIATDDFDASFVSVLPGGLNLTSTLSNTYFGENARIEFFERYKWIQGQREILSTQSTAPTAKILFPESFRIVGSVYDDDEKITSENVVKPNETITSEDDNFTTDIPKKVPIPEPSAYELANLGKCIALPDGTGTMTITKRRGGNHRRVNLAETGLEHAFSPFRTGATRGGTTVSTRIIIRTQSLVDGEKYSQQKLIPKPYKLDLDSVPKISFKDEVEVSVVDSENVDAGAFNDRQREKPVNSLSDKSIVGTSAEKKSKKEFEEETLAHKTNTDKHSLACNTSTKHGWSSPLKNVHIAQPPTTPGVIAITTTTTTSTANLTTHNNSSPSSPTDGQKSKLKLLTSAAHNNLTSAVNTANNTSLQSSILQLPKIASRTGVVVATDTGSQIFRSSESNNNTIAVACGSSSSGASVNSFSSMTDALAAKRLLARNINKHSYHVSKMNGNNHYNNSNSNGYNSATFTTLHSLQTSRPSSSSKPDSAGNSLGIVATGGGTSHIMQKGDVKHVVSSSSSSSSSGGRGGGIQRKARNKMYVNETAPTLSNSTVIGSVVLERLSESVHDMLKSLQKDVNKASHTLLQPEHAMLTPITTTKSAVSILDSRGDHLNKKEGNNSASDAAAAYASSVAAVKGGNMKSNRTLTKTVTSAFEEALANRKNKSNVSSNEDDASTTVVTSPAPFVKKTASKVQIGKKTDKTRSSVTTSNKTVLLTSPPQILLTTSKSCKNADNVKSLQSVSMDSTSSEQESNEEDDAGSKGTLSSYNNKPHPSHSIGAVVIGRQDFLGERTMNQLDGTLKSSPTSKSSNALHKRQQQQQRNTEQHHIKHLDKDHDQHAHHYHHGGLSPIADKQHALTFEQQQQQRLHYEAIAAFSFNKDGKLGIAGERNDKNRKRNPNSRWPKMEKLNDFIQQETQKKLEKEQEEAALLAAANAKITPLQFICVDHRDPYNKKIRNKMKTSSLFQYVESKQAQYDFNGNMSSDSDDDDILDLDRLNASTSPISPIALLPRGFSPNDTNISNKSLHDDNGGNTECRDNLASVGGKDGVNVGGRSRRPKGDSSSSVSQSSDWSSSDKNNISPRSKYIDSCLRNRLNPRASLILRKNFSKCLNLQHHGMGDIMAVHFADAVISVPYIESLNVSDNNLTDAGLGPLVKAVVHMKDLIDLDMSYNTIGPEAASCLSDYLSLPTCPLQRLVLRRADVDDGECERFISSLKTNRHLTELDLSENLIGTSENLNTVMPDLVTGGEALAELLKSEGCVLKTLRLGWNMLRLEGAAELCGSLKVNQTLTYLDLSYNSLGCKGGIALGDALQDNKVLKYLSVANNSINSVACLTICAGILENEALEQVVFDGNPIGEQGAKAVMLLPTMVGSRVRISVVSCNIGIRDPKCWFDSTMLVRRFEMRLSNPFDRAVSLLLMYLIACHQTYIIAHSELIDLDAHGVRTTTNLALTERATIDFEDKRLDAHQRAQIVSLQAVQRAASNSQSAVALFYELDEDGSGQLDQEEFGNLLHSMGMNKTKQQVRECMSEYDVDNCGFIEMPEFLLFLRNQARDAERKLKELAQFPVMCMASEPGVTRYVPPRSGVLKLVIIDGFTQKDTYRVLSAADRDYVIDIARQSGELLTMTTYGVQSYKMRFNEALGVVDTLLKENSNKTHILAKVLPQMASASDARAIVSTVLQNNKLDVQRLRREVGYALKPMLGCMDGHYDLDLTNEMDKFCLNKLLELSMTGAHRRASKSKLGYGLSGDCSQKGNWSAFRNEIFNGKPITVTSEFASPVPRSGRLEFDFVSEQRVGKDEFILNDVRFTNMLVRLFQLLPADKEYVLEKLQHSRINSDKTLHGNGKNIYEVPKERSAEIGNAMYAFYENLPKRQEEIDKYRIREGIKVQMDLDPSVTELTYLNVYDYLKIPSIVPGGYHHSDAGVAATGKNNRAANNGYKGGASTSKMTSSSTKSNANSKSAAAASHPSLSRQSSTDSLSENVVSSNAGINATVVLEDDGENLNNNIETETTATGEVLELIDFKPNELNQVQGIVDSLTHGLPLDEYMRRYICLLASTNVSAPSKAVRTLEVLLDAFEYQHFMARHLELLCEIFDKLGKIPCSEHFGTYRVELVVCLFSCVVDLHNFELVMRTLTSYEAACVICRLGWLHIYNPMKPEGYYQLDLGRREERIIVKTLAQLSVVEPGDNLPFISFRWERQMDPMPGYELTELWMTEDGLPHKGIWDAAYYSGEGVGKNGCKASLKFRRALLQLVLIEEEELVSETALAMEDSDGTLAMERKANLQGEAYMMANLSTFFGYLSYNEEEYKRLLDKKQAEVASKAKPVPEKKRRR